VNSRSGWSCSRPRERRPLRVFDFGKEDRQVNPNLAGVAHLNSPARLSELVSLASLPAVDTGLVKTMRLM